MKREKEIIQEFVFNAIYRLDESTRMVTMAFEHLDEKEVWKRPNSSSNSIGNLILHLCGNITQYAISSLGVQKDIRERDLEFSTREGLNKAELLERLTATVTEAKMMIENTPLEQWLKKHEVQGFHLSGIGIVLHVVEHYSYHTGQIAFWVKLLKNKDLGFYDGVNLTIKNKN